MFTYDTLVNMVSDARVHDKVESSEPTCVLLSYNTFMYLVSQVKFMTGILVQDQLGVRFEQWKVDNYEIHCKKCQDMPDDKIIVFHESKVMIITNIDHKL